MIETGTIHRARPACTRCGWVGAWHTSTRSETAAVETAQAHLTAHADFWHPST